MKTTAKRFMYYQFHDNKGIEERLESLAEQGLFLEKIGVLMWTFRRGEPQKVRYTVTYFAEGSMFNPTYTENQVNYYELARSAGWELMAENNQMQIFCSFDENPTPFDTDERAKFENIKKCMKKSFVPSVIILIVVFSLNVAVQIPSLLRSPVEFLSDYTRLFPLSVMIPHIIYQCFVLVSYFVWCRRSERSINEGGGCIEKQHRVQKFFDKALLIYTLTLLIAFIASMTFDRNFHIILLSVLQMPLLIIIFMSIIKLMRKSGVSAKVNRVVSYTVLTVATFGYLFLVVFTVVALLDFDWGSDREHRVVEHQLTETESREYVLYSDPIPLTNADLYGEDDYEFYSFVAMTSETFFVANETYYQSSLPAKDSPPELYYEIVRPKSQWMYDIAEADMLTPPHWSDDTVKETDPAPFYARQAYRLYYYDGDPKDDYILFYEDKIVQIELDNTPTPEQMAIIGEILREA